MSDELRFRRQVLADLTPYFKIRTEVRGTHWQGGRKRIDAILAPRDRTGWRDRRPRFGVEFKRDDWASTGDLTKVIAQCIDYSMTEWDGYGRLSIFMCGPDLAGFPDLQFFIPRLLGRFGVGELVLDGKYGWTLYRDGQRYWAEGAQDYWNGHCPNNVGSLIPKTGSR